jgi:hypothetical protein
MMEGLATAMGLGRRNEPNDNTLPAPYAETATQRTPGDRGDEDNDDESWALVMARTARGTTRPISQTQEGAQQATEQPQAQPPVQAAARPPTPQEDFSGITAALKRQGHQNYDVPVVAAELALQRDIGSNTTKQAVFKDFATNYTQLRVYLAMVGTQKTVTMIHTVGTFYSLRAATNAYQGKVLGFVGDRRATKEPTPVCLPQVKAWQWYAGQVNVAKDNFVEFFENEDNKNKWWTLSSQLTSDTKVPFLLTLPNAMVEILRETGLPCTPADVQAAMEEVTLRMGGGIMDDQWKTITEWCMVASQTDASDRKSLLSIEVDSVAVDEDEFDTWVETKLDMALGKRPPTTGPMQGAQAQQPQHVNDQL